MKLLRVCLPNRKNFTEELSYFSSIEAPRGSLVYVPLQGKQTPAIVLGQEDVSDAKTELRHSHFQVKKISKIERENFLTAAYMQAVEQTASLQAQPMGEIIRAWLPAFFLEHPKLFTLKEKGGDRLFEELIVQTDKESRFSFYKTIIREEFAKKQSVGIACPTIQEAETLAEEISRGIDSYVFVLHSNLTEKECKKRIQGIASAKHPVLIVGTPSYIHDLRGDCSTMIIEHENSDHYTTVQTPELDALVWLREYARAQKTKLIYADILLSPELIKRYEEKDIVEAMRLSWRLRSEIPLSLIDMKSEKESGSPIFSVELLEALDSSIKHGGKAVLFVARRGLYTITTCTNCNTILTCEQCEKPLVLHEKTIDGAKVRYYLCHTCNAKHIVDDQHEILCKHCGSWRLGMFGIGSQHIKELLEERYGKKSVFLIDGDTTTREKAEKIIEQFYEAKGAVLVGTEMMIPYLTKQVTTTAIVSFDSLFAIPDYNLSFKLIDIVENIRIASKKNCFVQTRLINEKVFAVLTGGMLQELYKEELDTRKRMQYPPFATFVRLVPRVGFSEHDLRRLPELCEDIGSVVFYKTKHKQKAALLRIEEKKWNEKSTRDKVLAFTGFADITVNPHHIL